MDKRKRGNAQKTSYLKNWTKNHFTFLQNQHEIPSLNEVFPVYLLEAFPRCFRSFQANGGQKRGVVET